VGQDKRVKQSIAQRGVVEPRFGELNIKGKAELISLYISSCGNLIFTPACSILEAGHGDFNSELNGLLTVQMGIHSYDTHPHWSLETNLGAQLITEWVYLLKSVPFLVSHHEPEHKDHGFK
jgi:hypothetical protein